MKTLRRNKRVLYVCELYEDNKLKKYKEPIKLFENWQVTNTDADLKALGMDAYIYIRIKTDLSHAKYYHLGDKVYINNPIPETHDVLCKTADYEVFKPPISTLNECEILLKKLSGK